jgi:hypothetical protein
MEASGVEDALIIGRRPRKAARRPALAYTRAPSMAPRPYPEVPSQPKLPEIEERVLAHWKEHGLFRASIENRRDAPEFVFYDGPPFANGLPHYGHLLTGYVKDIVPRYQTMRGKKVERRFGWDCQACRPRWRPKGSASTGARRSRNTGSSASTRTAARR